MAANTKHIRKPIGGLVCPIERSWLEACLPVYLPMDTIGLQMSICILQMPNCANIYLAIHKPSCMLLYLRKKGTLDGHVRQPLRLVCHGLGRALDFGTQSFLSKDDKPNPTG